MLLKTSKQRQQVSQGRHSQQNQKQENNLDDIKVSSVLDLQLHQDSHIDHIHYQLDGILNPKLSLSTKYAHCKHIIYYLFHYDSQDVVKIQLHMNQVQHVIHSFIAVHQKFILDSDEIIQLYFILILYYFINYHIQSFEIMKKNSNVKMEEVVCDTLIQILLGSCKDKDKALINKSESFEEMQQEGRLKESGFHKRRKLKTELFTLHTNVSPLKVNTAVPTVAECISELAADIQNKWGGLHELISMPTRGCTLPNSKIIGNLALLALNRQMHILVHDVADSRLLSKTNFLRSNQLDDESCRSKTKVLQFCQQAILSYGILHIEIESMLKNMSDMLRASSFTGGGQCFGTWLTLGLIDSSCLDNDTNESFLLSSSAGGTIPSMIRSASNLFPAVQEQVSAMLLELPPSHVVDAKLESPSLAKLFPELYMTLAAPDIAEMPGDLHFIDVFMVLLRCLATLTQSNRSMCASLNKHGGMQFCWTLMVWCFHARRTLVPTDGKSDKTLSPSETASERLVFDIGLFGLGLLSNLLEGDHFVRADVLTIPIPPLASSTDGKLNPSPNLRPLEFLCDWLLAETRTIMNDIIKTDALCSSSKLMIEEIPEENGDKGLNQDDVIPVAQIILSAHICLLLQRLAEDKILRISIVSYLPKKSFWLVIRILKAFITLQGKTGLYATDSIIDAIIALRLFEKYEVELLADSSNEVMTSLELSCLKARMSSPSPPKGKWQWNGRDFIWNELAVDALPLVPVNSTPIRKVSVEIDMLPLLPARSCNSDRASHTENSCDDLEYVNIIPGLTLAAEMKEINSVTSIHSPPSSDFSSAGGSSAICKRSGVEASTPAILVKSRLPSHKGAIQNPHVRNAPHTKLSGNRENIRGKVSAEGRKFSGTDNALQFIKSVFEFEGEDSDE